MAAWRAEPSNAVVGSVTFTSDHLVAQFQDGRRISLPLGWYPRLLKATPEERANWRLVGNGEGVRWPDVDEEVSSENLILGRPTQESETSLGRWLRSRRDG